MINTIIQGDCLEVMSGIPEKSIDLILCDLPYGTTACKWDTIIPFEPLWEQYKRVIKKNSAIVLFGSQPFTTIMNNSCLNMFRYEWIWEKQIKTGFMNCNKMPLKKHENISIFYKSLPVYNPQGIFRVNKNKKRKKDNPNTIYSNMGLREGEYIKKLEGYPDSIIGFQQETGLHPTQKPVALCEYLIKTYTNEGNLVLDNCIGSGTTAIACINTNRNFIGIEKEPEYVAIAQKRVQRAIDDKASKLF